jgi:glycosyltransferase involved in cell wall biosynthesis
MDTPVIGTVILNWNRLHLLRVTVESYLATISMPYELVIVDNASSESARGFIEEVCRARANHRAVFLDENLGGEAINYGLEQARGRYLHVSENDIEYLPGWANELVGKFEAFPELGQLSPFSPQPETSKGEIWVRHEAEPITRGGHTIYLTRMNITTTGIFRREIWDLGFRWSSYPDPDEPGKSFRFPNDVAASLFVRERGYVVAWNDRYTVINLGHNVEEWKQHLEYYLWNYRSKPWLQDEGMRQRLRARGYDLVEENGIYRIVAL